MRLNYSTTESSGFRVLEEFYKTDTQIFVHAGVDEERVIPVLVYEKQGGKGTYYSLSENDEKILLTKR